MNWESLTAIACTLLIILDPFGNAPIVHSLLRKVPRRRRLPILLRETAFITALLLFFYVIGGHILRYFDISDATLHLSGGLLLLLIAIGLIFPKINILGDDSPEPELPEDQMQPAKNEPFLVPITTPLVVGPAGLAYVMLQAAGGIAWQPLLAITIACLATGALMAISVLLISRCGKHFAMVLERLMGTFLTLLAIEMCFKGITLYLASLPH
ncbi:MAG: hypothetical protein MJ051_06395 [Akkermansia sp.]|nr:hypothetical protein [Akkermansia sp.]